MPPDNHAKTWNDVTDLVSTTPFNISDFETYCSKNSKIIDIGCGYGRICKELELNGYKNIVGIDSSSAQLNRASKNLKYTKLVLSNALNIPIEDGFFDVGISFGVINCLINKDDFKIYAYELNRLLQPNSYLFVNEFTRNDSPYFDDKYHSGIPKYKLNRVFTSNSGLVYRHYSIAEILTELDPYFDLVKSERHKFKSLNHTHEVNGYTLILQKPEYVSRFR